MAYDQFILMSATTLTPGSELDSSSEGTILTTNMDGNANDDGNDLSWVRADYSSTVMTDADDGGNNTVTTGQPGDHFASQTDTTSTLLASYKFADSVTTMSDGSTVIIDVYARVLSDGRVFYDFAHGDIDFGNDLGIALGGPSPAKSLKTIELGTFSEETGFAHDDFRTTLQMNPICFARGVLIGAEHGEVEVQDLAVGDWVATVDNGLQQIRWIGMQHMSWPALEVHPNLRPIRIEAGALGPGVPETDLVVSPQHRIIVSSRIAERMCGVSDVFIAAKLLTDMPGISIDDACMTVDYFHILLDHHEVLFANGALAESLFLGPQAIKSLAADQLDEIGQLFPELATLGQHIDHCRLVLNGRKGRQMASRHLKNDMALVPCQNVYVGSEDNLIPPLRDPVPTWDQSGGKHL